MLSINNTFGSLNHSSLPIVPVYGIPLMVHPSAMLTRWPAKQDFMCIPRNAIVGGNDCYIFAQMPLSDPL